MDEVICIGVVNGIEVNAVNARYKANGTWRDQPCVEIRRANGVRMLLPELEMVIDLLQEALAYWQEVHTLDNDT